MEEDLEYVEEKKFTIKIYVNSWKGVNTPTWEENKKIGQPYKKCVILIRSEVFLFYDQLMVVFEVRISKQ